MDRRNGTGSGNFVRILLLLGVAVLFCQQSPTGDASSASHVPDRMPRIGILSMKPLPLASDTMSGESDNLQKYRDAVASWGAVIVPIVLAEPASESASKLVNLDGLLLPGGGDIDPMLYGERPHPKLEKVNRAFDEFELAALKIVTDRGVPVLGICRGHQLMNVFRGGTLWQDIPSQVASGSNVLHRIRIAGNSASCSHSIRIEPETLAGELLSSPTIDVNSYHHQAVKSLGTALRITASSPDGIAETIEPTTGPFFVGVQFHPEKMLPKRAEFGRIFEAFVDAARRYRQMSAVFH
ncbi:MAG TPA: gamma-glutamyl-gamma-aminobutyrate hydrolase family protein [Candidatus Ozemobacteraceae bacterium]|nr:gamma-glutamyl-gamma-aminobutyrate hydrolase family protein [Candidatus Ozemobacteraceae bacterium]